MIGQGIRRLSDRFTPVLRAFAGLGFGSAGQVLTTDGSSLSWETTASPGAGVEAWVNFNGTGTVAIRGSYNVSSITDNGTGDYTVNFTTALADANYALSATCGGGPAICLEHTGVGPSLLRTASSVRVRTVTANTAALSDAYVCSVSISR